MAKITVEYSFTGIKQQKEVCYMSKIFYDQKIDAIRAIPDHAVRQPGNVPVTVYLQEAENLCSWCKGDREELMANGLQWSFVEDIPVRAGALREAQSRWISARHIHDNSEKVWLEKAPGAALLRDEILRAMRFSYSKNTPLKIKLSAIKRGGSHAAVIQNLNDLAVLGKEHPEPLKIINFDMSKLDLAAAAAAEMASLLGAVTTERTFCNRALKIRNQAYTHLKEAVDEVRRFGQYLYRTDHPRLKGYTSEYSRRTRKRLESKKAEEAMAGVTV